jgi:hypothetical protein
MRHGVLNHEIVRIDIDSRDRQRVSPRRERIARIIRQLAPSSVGMLHLLEPRDYLRQILEVAAAHNTHCESRRK